MKLVVCEGLDDIAVVRGICEHASIGGLEVEHCGGRDNLVRHLAELQVRPEFARRVVESLVVIIDAEESGQAAWRKLCSAVRLAFAVDLPQPGVFAGATPRIAGLVVPDENGRGMIEDLCLASVADQPGYPCLEEYFRCLSERTGRARFLAKARFRAWMASQSEFDLRVGRAAERGYIPWESPAFAVLRDLLTRL